jgi:hypothetical protein
LRIGVALNSQSSTQTQNRTNWLSSARREKGVNAELKLHPYEELQVFDDYLGRSLSGFGRLSIVCNLPSAVFEPEAVTVHLEYMDVMSKPVEQRACQSLGTLGSTRRRAGC